MIENMKNPFTGMGPEKENNPGQQSQPGKKKKNQEQSLIAIATGSGNELYYEESIKRAYCCINFNGIKQILDIDEDEFGKLLAYAYFKKFGSSPNKFTLQSVQSILHTEAQFFGERVVTYNRIACLNDRIIINLMDRNGNVVIVDKTGWKVTQCPSDIHFKQYMHQESLPTPVPGGDLKDLFKLVNLTLCDEDKALILSWLITAYFTDISGAFLWLIGTEGSGKTLLGKFVKSLIDPIKGGGFDLHHNHMEVTQVLAHNCIPYFDNFSKMSMDISNLFCLAYSGGIIQKRKLYSNSTDYILRPHKTAMFAGIRLPSIGSDLLDRSLVVRFDRIHDSKRMLEEQLVKEFTSMQPQLFGAVLDALSKVLGTYGSVKLDRYVRTADFQVRGVAAAEALGFDRDVFLRAMERNELSRKQKIVESNGLVQAVNEVLNCKGSSWSFNASELLEELEKMPNLPCRLPSSPAKMGEELNKCAQLLDRIGIQLSTKPYRVSGNTKKYTLTRTQRQTHRDPAVESGHQQPVATMGTSSVDQLIDNMLEEEVGYSVTSPQEDQGPLVIENTEDSVVEGISIHQPGQENPMVNGCADSTSTPVKENGFQKTLINPDKFKKPTISFENEEEDSDRNFSWKYDPKPSAGRYEP